MNLLCDFLSCRKQRIVLNGQLSSWDNITAGVPQGSILGALLFLIRVNDLPNNLSSNCKLFADDTFLFSVVNNNHTSAATSSQDLNGITNLAFQWKMILNPDLSKQAQKVIFSRKIKKLLYPTLLFNNISLSNSLFQKHLGLTFDIKLNFSEHIKSITRKINKTLGLLRKFEQILPRSSLLTIYKTFIRRQLHYVDIIYDQAYNSVFHDKLESIQYNACLAITGAIRGTATEKIYQELGLESLKPRRWFRKLYHFYKIFNEKSPFYLLKLIPNFNRIHNTRLSYNIPPIKVRHDYFKNSFFPSAISEWNKLDLNIRNSASLNTLKKASKLHTT